MRRCAPWTARSGKTRVRRGREYDATAHQFGANSGIAAMLDARYFVPISKNSIYAPGWSLYFLQPENPDAIEPPAEIKAQQELCTRSCCRPPTPPARPRSWRRSSRMPRTSSWSGA